MIFVFIISLILFITLVVSVIKNTDNTPYDGAGLLHVVLALTLLLSMFASWNGAFMLVLKLLK